jgi:hypothetical protein
VVEALVAKGVDRLSLQITYHGKGTPLVPTPDHVPEPRNGGWRITVR